MASLFGPYTIYVCIEFVMQLFGVIIVVPATYGDGGEGASVVAT